MRKKGIEIVGFNGYKPIHETAAYLEVLRKAAESNPRPDQSGYFVRTGGMNADGEFFRGGNYEYAITDAQHGEEAVITAMLNAPVQAPAAIIGFSTNRETLIPPRHCGNCRDYINQFSGPELETIVGNNHQILVVPYEQTYLVEDFREHEPTSADLIRTEELITVLKACGSPYSQNQGGNHLYAAGVLSGMGFVKAPFEPDVAYDPTLALRFATLLMKGTAQKKSDLEVDLVAIASLGYPRIHYKDRQQLLEFLDRHTHNSNVPIILCSVQGPYHDYFKTTSQEWLPHPFAPSVLLGPDGLRLERERSLAPYRES